ncbi:hypothetical protein CEXT_615351 [Caerostris extrusa]|uniref:Uncharacterized protein n=1 Tax=Caerostris extrusa TaxID=172846 RepID=A0AAV4RFW0_CAEEX|nr:hypothetical protein CEXT_615351 [Caerostris extrusa]
MNFTFSGAALKRAGRRVSPKELQSTDMKCLWASRAQKQRHPGGQSDGGGSERYRLRGAHRSVKNQPTCQVEVFEPVRDLLLVECAEAVAAHRDELECHQFLQIAAHQRGDAIAFKVQEVEHIQAFEFALLESLQV